MYCVIHVVVGHLHVYKLLCSSDCLLWSSTKWKAMSELDSLIQSESNKRNCVKCQSRLCLQSKAATVIVLWTVFIGAVCTTVAEVVAFVKDNNVASSVDSVVTYRMTIFYFVLCLCILSLDMLPMPAVVVSRW